MTRSASSRRWVVFAVLAAAVYCAGAFFAVYRHNQTILAEANFAEITGGGFIYNYRIADIRSGITVGLVKPLPPGTRLLAEFENPAGGKIEMEQTVTHAKRNYKFETPSLKGVAADREYLAVLSVIDGRTGAKIERHQTSLKSSVAPKSMPSKPLTIGLGYHLNLDTNSAQDG
ncbi:hypothetical protein [uncultured Roseibium sp.]|uniref:hypothetical protein n=1 Tax=uncultured Roseibium sp. TaxID=1936171 RepID=UPI002608D435|nr:hypothetical protein [uncultured Roseibium sp.]